MYKLWPLLIVDCLADGMVNYSLTSYYLDVKFHISAATLGDITSIAFFLAALSSVFSGPLAKTPWSRQHHGVHACAVVRSRAVLPAAPGST